MWGGAPRDGVRGGAPVSIWMDPATIATMCGFADWGVCTALAEVPQGWSWDGEVQGQVALDTYMEELRRIVEDWRARVDAAQHPDEVEDPPDYEPQFDPASADYVADEEEEVEPTAETIGSLNYIRRHLLVVQHHNSRIPRFFAAKRGTGFAYRQGWGSKEELYQWVFQTYGARWVSTFQQKRLTRPPPVQPVAAPGAAGPSGVQPPQPQQPRFDARAAAVAARTQDASRQAGTSRMTRSQGKRPAREVEQEEEEEEEIRGRRVRFDV